MADVDLDIRINALVDKKFNDIEKTLKKTEGAAKKVEKNFGGLSKSAIGVGVAVAGIGTALSFVVDQAILMEDLTTQFISFTGSAESAADQVERLAEFSASTPFQLEDLANANRTLLAFGSSTEESLVQLKQLGEAAAATGKDIGELATIFGQIQVEGRLTSERFNQLIERGINIGPALADSLGVAESQLKSLRAQGKISSDDVAEAFEKMTTGAGIFAGAMERQSRTISGSISTLKDNISALAASIGKTLQPAIVFVVDEATNASKVAKLFIDSLKAEKFTPIEQKINDTKVALAGYVEELILLRQDSKAANVSQDEFTQEIAETEAQIRSTTEALKKLQKARLAEDPSGGTPVKPDDPKDDPVDPARVQAQEKINEELLNLSRQAVANRNALAAAETEAEVAIIDERFAKINEKIIEQETARLELNKQFDDAETLQVEAKLNNIAAIEDKKREDDKRLNKKARDDEFNFEKIAAEESFKFQQKTDLQKARAVRDGLGHLAGLQRSGVKEFFGIAKAAALAQAAIAIPETALQAYKSGVGIGGPPLGLVFSAAATVTQLANLARIQSAKFTGFADGGLVEGGTPGQDSVPALLTPGEVVVPEKNFNDIRMNNGENVTELKRLNRNIETQNEILFNVANNTNDTAIGTQQVAVGVANIQLPGINNPGAGANYTEWNIEAYAEAGRILAEQEGQRQAQEFANDSVSTINPGQANIQTGS